ncbi:MAG: hypothetical protein CMP07_07160 [Xanthomonadales bacterium]|nr:hypothetical protein [Xanthomonadales bacterium]|tara:strand:+ start:564 stop:1181 length:618 start_codon:yes stop_codon:yes gene_type:complete
MPTRGDRQNERIRQEVAAEAARILATEGQRNYGQAKQKAAHRLGLSGRSGLPSNAEVEAELKRYRAMYGGEELADDLVEKRRAALEAMKFFGRFRPKLVGPVLEGTSDRHSRISLHVFCETEDDVIAFLLSRNIRFEQETRRIRWHDNSYRDLELVVIEADGQCFELALMAGASWKQPPPDPVDGRAQRRAGTQEIERLINEPGL